MRTPRREAAARRLAGVAAVCLLAPALGGCGGSSAPAPTAHATADGVTVTVTLLRAANAPSRLRVVFSPQQSGFHIYSIDLPDQGIDGLGIPTRIAVRGGLAALGKAAANLPTRLLRPAGLPAELPVYPDGPVTFTLPVRRTSSGRAEVVVSYGACSEARCLMPVTDEIIPLRLS